MTYLGYGPIPRTTEAYVYFGGRLIATAAELRNAPGGVQLSPVLTDRIGSVRVSAGTSKNYFPHGLERTATPNGGSKFGTYWRDANSGLDYANQRYYMPGWGRFLSADPSGSADPADPGSWNQYAYVGGDPVNFNDPDGLVACGDLLGFGTGGRTLRDLIMRSDDTGALARLVWAESSGSIFSSWYILEKTAVAVSVVNRWKISNGLIYIKGADGINRYPSFGGSTYADIIGSGYQSIQKGTTLLTAGFQSTLNRILAADISVGRQAGIENPATGEMYSINESCFNVIQSYVAGNLGVRNQLADPFASQGVTTHFNLGNANPDPGRLVGFGNVGSGAPTYFFGYPNVSTQPFQSGRGPDLPSRRSPSLPAGPGRRI